MRKNKAIYIQILFFFLFVIVTVFFMPLASSNHWKQLRDCAVYEGGWKVDSATDYAYYYTLPTFYYPEGGGQDIWISKELINISDGDCIGFFSFEQQVDILLDGEKVYSFMPPSYMKSQTPGNKWNFLPVNASDNGKRLSIHIHQCYSKGRVTIPTIYFGTQSGITLNYISQENPRIYLSIATLFVGCLLGLFHLFKRNSTYVGDALKWLAFFAIFRGLWSYIESNTYSFFIPRLLIVSQISYMSLKLAVVVYLQFLNQTFHDGKNKVLHVLTICSFSEFFVTFLLQYFGIADFANTVFITHAIMLVAGIYTCIDITLTLHRYRRNSSWVTATRRYSYIAQLLCALIVVFTSIIDMVRYYSTNSPDVACFSRVGDFFYVIIMSLALFMDFVYLLKMGQKAAIIREEASLDAITKLNNRASFERDISRGNKRLWINRSIVLLDLNNLKLFNDTKGHDIGDYYIVTASQIIHNVFSPFGSVYRIGGDEFCVIARNLTLEQFLVLRDTMEAQIRDKNTHGDTLQMAIASGYAAFDDSKDKDLHDTMKRADAEMYCRKQELKKN